MEIWLASYEDREGAARTVESRTALDAAKDFALLVPRGDDCAVVVSPAADNAQRLVFDRRGGVFRERQPPPPAPVAAVPPVAVPSVAAPPRVAPRGDTFSYRGWLVSDSFLKRVCAVMGYHFVGSALLGTVFLLLVYGALVSCMSLLNFAINR